MLARALNPFHYPTFAYLPLVPEVMLPLPCRKPSPRSAGRCQIRRGFPTLYHSFWNPAGKRPRWTTLIIEEQKWQRRLLHQHLPHTIFYRSVCGQMATKGPSVEILLPPSSTNSTASFRFYHLWQAASGWWHSVRIDDALAQQLLQELVGEREVSASRGYSLASRAEENKRIYGIHFDDDDADDHDWAGKLLSLSRFPSKWVNELTALAFLSIEVAVKVRPYHKILTAFSNTHFLSRPKGRVLLFHSRNLKQWN